MKFSSWGSSQTLAQFTPRQYGLNKLLQLAVVLAGSLLAGTVTAAQPGKPMTVAQYQQQWGPDVGSMVASLAATDQQGKLRDLAGLAGPNGLLLFLVRSADW